MTATDWLEFSAASLSNSLASFALTVTIASGYLVMTYMVGKKLATSQLWILNTLFILVMTIVAFGDFAALSDAVRGRQEAMALLPHWQSSLPASANATVLISLVANILLILGCLKFMWDIRRAKD